MLLCLVASCMARTCSCSEQPSTTVQQPHLLKLVHHLYLMVLASMLSAICYLHLYSFDLIA